MDIKKRVEPPRTLNNLRKASSTVRRTRATVRKGATTKKNVEKQVQNNSGENESTYASQTTMRAAKEVRKRVIKASYKGFVRLYKARDARRRYKAKASAKYEPSTALRLNERNASARGASTIKPRGQIANGHKQVPSPLSKQTLHTRQKTAFRKSVVRNNFQKFQQTAKTVKQGLSAAFNGAMAVFRGGKSIMLLIGAAGGNLAMIACVVALVAAILSPFAFLFSGNTSVDDYPSLAEVASDINTEYTAKFQSIINDHDDVDEIEIKDYEIDSANYVAINWKDILSIWSVNNDIYRGEKKTDEELIEIDPDKPVEQEELPYVMTDKNVTSLTNMFWEFNDITYEVKNEEVEVDPGASPAPSSSKSTVSTQQAYIPDPTPSPSPTPETKTVKTLIITPVSKDYLWGADHYSFDDDQREWLEDLMSDKYQKEWSMLLLGIVGTEMTDVQKQLLESLPAGPGATIALNASTRLGHPYSKQKRGQGLYVDCSYLARWCYREAGYDWFTPATAAEQARWCDNNDYVVERSKLKAGDLLFYSFAKNGRYKNVSHVAVYVGRAKDGKEYMIDASSSNGFVVYREVFTDNNLVMCGRPLMYLNK